MKRNGQYQSLNVDDTFEEMISFYNSQKTTELEAMY
jgi:hypothetical protein